MILRKLSLPKGLNLHILAEVIPEEELEFMVKELSGKSRRERRVIFPSRTCLRKCLIHFLVNKHDGDFKKVLELLRDQEGILAWKGLHIGNLKRMYFQRCKEIEKENLKENKGE